MADVLEIVQELTKARQELEVQQAAVVLNALGELAALDPHVFNDFLEPLLRDVAAILQARVKEVQEVINEHKHAKPQKSDPFEDGNLDINS